jgi:hypothetical protein
VADIGPDFVAAEDLVETSPEPLSGAERAAHIQESMPPQGASRALVRVAAASCSRKAEGRAL